MHMSIETVNTNNSINVCTAFITYGINLTNADKIKHMIMSRDQNAGRSYSMKTDNNSIERVEEFNI